MSLMRILEYVDLAGLPQPDPTLAAAEVESVYLRSGREPTRESTKCP
jgi:hypothetical protein